MNGKLPITGIAGAARVDLVAVQAALLLAQGEVLVKAGLPMTLPPGCYSRIAPRSGLAFKRFINVGAGVIDSDYRGELGVLLFKFSKEDFIINMGNKIARLIFEKIQTPKIKKVSEVGKTGRGNKGYCST